LPKGAVASSIMWTDPAGSLEKDPFRPEELMAGKSVVQLEQYVVSQVFLTNGLATAGVTAPPLGQLVTAAGVAAQEPWALIFPPEKRSYPIGVALARPVPEEWYKDKSEAHKQVRVAAIGNGQIFNDEEMTPAKERLLVNTCNWLVGRDDYLPRDSGGHWQFPRLQMEDKTKQIWLWGATIGPSVLFAYLGFIVYLLRRVR
jgi:hypothetical protein